MSKRLPASAYRPMTPEERECALALCPGHVTYLPGSPDKRFARSMAVSARFDSSAVITEPQAEYLRRLVWKYRRQLPEKIRAYVPEKPALQYPLVRSTEAESEAHRENAERAQLAADRAEANAYEGDLPLFVGQEVR